MAIAPGFTVGFERPRGARSTASSGLNARPVASTPIRAVTVSSPTASHTRARTKGFATPMSAKGRPESPAADTLPDTPTTAIPKRSGATRASAG